MTWRRCYWCGHELGPTWQAIVDFGLMFHPKCHAQWKASAMPERQIITTDRT